ncbi:HET-domain-containing protein, partial [Tothia fuscella]
PNRVIEIAESGERQYCRLIAPNKCELEFMPYLALSHCWGKAATPTKTTMASLASHRERIPLAALPRTFRDAIDVANALNISYIWIDSLCIVQDDPEDWEREAARMASIYRNSYLTIAAVSAHNSSEGLFLDNPGSTKFIDDPFDSDKGRRVYLLPFTRGASKDSDPTHFWPLTSRAWTLQECLLSPRLLCFARDQIYWRCSRTFLSEDGTFQRHSSAALIHAEPEKSRLPLAGLLASYSPSDAFDIWCRWFSEYVERQLTIAEDRLPAWAGITWYYHTATGYTPLVGCWKEDL